MVKKKHINDPFWLNDPRVLLGCHFIPLKKMTDAERLNALTRLLLLTVLVMYFMDYEHWLMVLILGLLLIIILRGVNQENFSAHRGTRCDNMGCSLNPTMAYINTKYETSPQNQFSHVPDSDNKRSWTHAHYNVIPVDTPAPYRPEAWSNEPRYCNEFTQYPKSYEQIPFVNGSERAWRYVDETANLPTPKCQFSDHQSVSNLPGYTCDADRKHSSHPVFQQPFMRDTMDFRQNILGSYVDQIYRDYNHVCTDFKPGRKTF